MTGLEKKREERRKIRKRERRKRGEIGEKEEKKGTWRKPDCAILNPSSLANRTNGGVWLSDSEAITMVTYFYFFSFEREGLLAVGGDENGGNKRNKRMRNDNN